MGVSREVRKGAGVRMGVCITLSTITELKADFHKRKDSKILPTVFLSFFFCLLFALFICLKTYHEYHTIYVHTWYVCMYVCTRVHA